MIHARAPPVRGASHVRGWHMKVMCAYCEKDGVPALICEKEPLDNPMISHGICPKHRRELQQEIEGLATRVAPIRKEGIPTTSRRGG